MFVNLLSKPTKLHRGRFMHLVFLREKSLVSPDNCTKPPDLTTLAWVRWPLCSDFLTVDWLGVHPAVVTQAIQVAKFWEYTDSVGQNSAWLRPEQLLGGIILTGGPPAPYHTSWLCTHIIKLSSSIRLSYESGILSF